jgi:hypothetical protein
VSLVGLPSLPVAGWNLARCRISLQVVESSAEEPLELVTVQSFTLPSGPTARRKRVVPCSSLRAAVVG